MKQLLRSKRWLWAIVAVAVIAGLVFGGIALASAAKPTSNPEALSAKPTPTPWPSPPPTPPNQNQPVHVMTQEEVENWVQQAQEESSKRGAYEYSTSGPSTVGASISVAGKMIKLPDDAYIQNYIQFVDCIGGTPCPHAPVYAIARGNSLIVVDNDGKIIREDIAQGDEGAFDSLKKALR